MLCTLCTAGERVRQLSCELPLLWSVSAINQQEQISAAMCGQLSLSSDTFRPLHGRFQELMNVWPVTE